MLTAFTYSSHIVIYIYALGIRFTCYRTAT
ncbi:conserved hypothetical protein [Xenorhabdus bovienii str. kraussei Quebec]|uniref:Uncharacterized protein n=2 Tax=Xenorhabdus bovienii TaxID=40576 RepID=A0A077PBE3_XENBV|nr:conserved hypothetical protein [Xenorhabdus bovienii str. kraussei Quebec]CDH30839.1 conserved hypothetical protein [Xenorhabdus bovienii str. Intermedium]